jgi:hypothetical protein
VKPGLEPAHLGVIAIFRQVPRRCDGRFLHNLVRLRVGQAGLNRKIAHEFAINPVKSLPAFGVVTRLEPVQQARSRLNGTGFVRSHCGHHTLKRHPKEILTTFFVRILQLHRLSARASPRAAVVWQ